MQVDSRVYAMTTQIFSEISIWQSVIFGVKFCKARTAGTYRGVHMRTHRWVKKQRHYKKALDRAEPSWGMMEARVAKLNALGFA